MKNLPRLPLLFFLLISFFVLALPSKTYASTVYFEPVEGFVEFKEFLISVYVESTTTEPEIASANVKITYPSSIDVLSVNNGEFDSYIQKDFDSTTRTVTINAVNNAGNYKSGNVKLASVRFEVLQNSQQAALTVTSDS